MNSDDYNYSGQVDHDYLEQGIGRQISKTNGDIYEGEFKNGLYNGYGRMIYASDHNVAFYTGKWVEGRKHGYGLQMDKKGKFNQGNWKNG